jgi:SAM-dependent methyltransferase
MSTERERRGVFGEAADDYEKARPGYPTALVDDVLAAAGPGPALEVGAGTGKATVAFAAHDIDVTCIEPDDRMAAVLRRKVPASVTVVSGSFEDWTPDRPYGLLYSAQAWHWIDPDRRVSLAHAALAPGGLLALFWNAFLLTDAALHADLAVVDERHGLAGEHTAHAWHVDRQPVEIADFAVEWPSLGLTGDSGFADLQTRRYHSTLTYPSADYRHFLLTTSLYRMLDPVDREAVLAETTAVIDAHGGTITGVIHTDLALARRV